MLHQDGSLSTLPCVCAHLLLTEESLGPLEVQNSYLKPQSANSRCASGVKQ